MSGWEIDEECTANQRGTESPPLVEVLDDEELPVDSSEIEGCTANQEPDDDEVVDISEIEDSIAPIACATSATTGSTQEAPAAAARGTSLLQCNQCL